MSEAVPFYRPPVLTDDELNGLKEKIAVILKSGRLTKGPYVMNLESSFRETLGVNYVHACGSCSIGLLIALNVLRLWRRYRVKTVALPAFAWESTLYGVTQNGYQPIFQDVDPETWNITGAHRVADAVVPVHAFGNVCQVEAKVPVVYDAAHAFGADVKDFGDISVFSLAATKPVTSCEGGVIVTNDLELSKRIVQLRDKIGRLSEVHAVIALTYLEKFPSVHERRKQIFEYYRRKLPYRFQKVDKSHSYSVFGMLCKNPEEVLKKLDGKVETRRYYDPLAPLPTTVEIKRRIVCLPCYSEIDEKKIVEWIVG